MAIDQYESKLVAIFVQGILYGAFVILFALTYWTLVYRRPPGRSLNKPMLGVSITLFILATIHVIINFIRLHQAFVTHKDMPGSYWNRLSDFTQIFGSTVYVAQTVVGDGVALYRCYVVWSRRPKYIIFPTLLFFGSIAAGAGTLMGFGKQQHAEIFQFQHWIIAFFSCTLATSTACTLMIATRIWFLNSKSINEQPGGSLRPIMCIVLESGAIYSCTLITLLILFATKSWFQYVLVDALSPIIGLTFSIIIVRVGLGLTADGSSYTSSCSSRFSYIRRPSRRNSHIPPSQLWPTQPNRPTLRTGTGTGTSLGSRGRGHYHLRSQASHPSSYFRTSEEIEIDTELEVELDEARHQRPRALPIALVLPRSER